MKDFLEAGKIINTHGVRGEIKLESWCDTPHVLAGIRTYYLQSKDGSFDALPIGRAYVQKRFVIALPESFSTFEQAVALRERVVYAARADLPLAPGAHFVADLIGLPVCDKQSGKQYGTLRDVINRGATDLYEVDTGNEIVYLPAVAEFIAEVTENVILVTPIPGMFDSAEEV